MCVDSHTVVICDFYHQRIPSRRRALQQIQSAIDQKPNVHCMRICSPSLIPQTTSCKLTPSSMASTGSSLPQLPSSCYNVLPTCKISCPAPQEPAQDFLRANVHPPNISQHLFPSPAEEDVFSCATRQTTIGTSSK